METKKTYIVYLVILILTALSATSQAQNLAVHGELKQLVHDAVESSQAVQMKENEANIAENNRKKAYQTYLPTLDITGSFTHLNEEIRFPDNLETLLVGTQKLLIKEQMGLGFNTPLPPSVPVKEVAPIQEQDIFKATLQADMVVFSGLKVPFLAKAAEHQRNAYHALSNAKKSAVIRQTLQAYQSLALIRESEKVLDKSQTRLNEQKRYVNKAIENGLTTDLAKSRIQLAEQKLEEKNIELDTKRELVLSLLQQLTGNNKTQLEQLNPRLEEWSVGRLQLSAKHRPELQALQEAQRATEFKKKSVYSNFLPKVKIFGRKELYEDDLSILDPKWMVGVGLQWNIFDGLKRSRDLQNAKIEVLNSRLKKDLVSEKLELNLTKESLALSKAKQKMQVAQKQLHTSKKTYTINRKQYKVGLSSQKDFLDAESDLQKAELGYSQSLFNHNMAVVNYLVAGGKLNSLFGINNDRN
ncbi:TolC family protein [Fodinibius halophilus]|uniref:TolC family protein n=1 Tax=Fodinibius halophilus TaxID=1736908 RepID=A0A6M1T7Q9_9BACT|nr:TolC family protein [Fodinibius halophilus]NGP87164.1 TolC family protein [Fodinibius halophilus]